MSNSGSSGRAGRILIIEDYAGTANGLRALLRSRGHHVDIVMDADTALSRIVAASYDVVLTDLDLGGEGGPDLVARLRRSRPHVALLVVTARDRATVLEALHDATGVDCLEKPVDPERLVTAVEASLSERPSPDRIQSS